MMQTGFVDCQQKICKVLIVILVISLKPQISPSFVVFSLYDADTVGQINT